MIGGVWEDNQSTTKIRFLIEISQIHFLQPTRRYAYYYQFLNGRDRFYKRQINYLKPK